jgi:chlorophyll(ide) b reductase
MRILQNILKGRHARLRGLERPLGAVVFPAYLWGALSVALGLHCAAVSTLTGAVVGATFAAIQR